MTGEAQLLVEVWDAIRDYLPAAKRADSALGIVRAFHEYGFEARDLSGALDEDRDLAEALEVVAGEVDGDDEDAGFSGYED